MTIEELEKIGIKVNGIIGFDSIKNYIEYSCTIKELNIEFNLAEPLSMENVFKTIYEHGILKGMGFNPLNK